jgi:hypothetical protein
MDTLDWEKNEVFRLLKGQPGTHYQEADDSGKLLMRNWVKGLLTNSEVTVQFVKADGTVREMLCTLDSNRIPTKPAPATVVGTSTANVDGLTESKKPRKEPDPHSIRVYDLEKAEWRSFRFDRLQKITAEISFS